jgi:hypothetical protein
MGAVCRAASASCALLGALLASGAQAATLTITSDKST